MAAEESAAGSFTGGAAAAEARVGTLGTWRRSVQCGDRRSVSLEPVVQSRIEMLQKSAAKINLMARNLSRPHSPPRGAGDLLKLSCLQSSGGIGAGGEAGARG
jgi:hypothetical protein